MSEIDQPLNLVSLAKSASDRAMVPGTTFEVACLTESSRATLERSLWLLVLMGELIIDLPHGDFRILKVGDSLHLPTGLQISFEPLEDVVLLRVQDV